MSKASKKRVRFLEILRRELRWLVPGIGVKRWVLLIILGATIIGLGFAVLLVNVYRSAPSDWLARVLRFIALQDLNRVLRAIIFGGIGLLCVGFGIWGLNRSLLRPFLKPGKAVVDTVSTFRRRERGPKVVAIGGGNGLSTLLSGLKHHTSNITAIVTVADDGGSSGELRKNIGILPPGDIRNCLAALADDEQLLSQIFQYRFAESAGLNGHPLGNLFITALTDITGNFEDAVAESGRVLAIQGKVLPSTLHNVKLVASVHNQGKVGELRIEGESRIAQSGGTIRRVWLEPGNPTAFPPALQAILGADLIIIGPGSLFTSIMPNLLVPDLTQAIRASRAMKFYVCNVATEIGETDHFTCDDHAKIIEKHLGHHLVDVFLLNNKFVGNLGEGVEWVKPLGDFDQKYPTYQNNLVDPQNPWRHDRAKLAATIIDLYLEKTGPLASKVDY
jgi:uncharacterized cofD-like protein